MQTFSAKLAVVLLVSGLFSEVHGQSAASVEPMRYFREAGNFYFKNYAIRDYKAAAQNWGVLQDQYGNMVFANGDGVLIYDGKKWTVVETPTQSVIRSMAKDSRGRIYIGALDDIGFIDSAPSGKPVYVSLLEKLNPNLHKMGNIWATHVHGDLIYFEAETGLFTWNSERFTFLPWPNDATFHKSFVWRDVLHVYEQGTGIMQLKGGKLSLAPGGEFFKNMRIYTAMPLANDAIVLGTKYDGLYIYNGESARVFETLANPYLKSFEIYTGLSLSDDKIAVGTKFGGVVIIDKTGNIQYMICRENGLPTNNVRSLGKDSNNDLWLALDEGITHVEISSDISIYDERNGLDGSVNDVIRHRGDLYVTTGSGTYILQPAELPVKRALFSRISLPQEAGGWQFQVVAGKLLLSTTIGVFEVNGKVTTRLSEQSAYGLHRFKADSLRVIAGGDRGLYSLRLENGKWKTAGVINDVVLDNTRFNETIPGKLWITTFSQGAVLVSFVNADGTVDYDNPTVKKYGPTQGLPEGFSKISTVSGKESFRVGTASRLFHFDYSADRFYPDSTFATRFGFSQENVFPVSNELPSGTFLVKSKRNDDGTRQLFIVSPRGKEYFRQRYDMSRIFDNVGVITYWDQAHNVAWHVGAEVMVRQKLEPGHQTKTNFTAYLNKIIIGKDSVMYEGVGQPPVDVVIPYGLASLRFEYTSNNFVAEENNNFQYKLDGYDENWSEWTTESIKEYSRLWEGTYTFSVRSKDYAGLVSQPASISFSVSAPWFRSPFAYIAYLLMLGYGVWMLIRWRSNKLEQEKIALQKEIEHQTQEIREQNVQLAEQSEELRVSAEQLKELDTLKSNFFVNISHEFRTPLSLIIGPLEKSIADKEGDIKHQEVQRMHRNAKKLQQLINQLLDLAKLEAGKMKVVEQRSDLFYFLRVLTASFESLADVRNIRFEVDIPPNGYETYFDTDKIETVLFNLLSNAFKFTPDGGLIKFEVSIQTDGADNVTIGVSDTGPGIPPESVNRIFDRFYQVDSSSSREYEGSGIGLSLVKELVALLKGNIHVHSEVGEGTSFTLALPLTRLTSVEMVSTTDERADGQTDTEMKARVREDASETADATPSSEEIILLIEDNPDLRDYLRESLEPEYRIEVAENGQIGLQKALEIIPDLILSDMMMPLMDGFTLCTRIREDERTSHIPFILLTARTAIESKLAGLELGADEYMTKPFNMKEVHVRIKNLLGQRKNLRKTYGKEVTVQPKNISITSVDERFLNHALEIVETHLSDPQFSVERFAEEIGMSRKNLLRKIKALTDQSVNEFIRNFRLRRAAQLIEGRAATISEIAYQVGFNNLSYFSRCFKELFGTLPHEMAAKSSVADSTSI